MNDTTTRGLIKRLPGIVGVSATLFVGGCWDPLPADLLRNNSGVPVLLYSRPTSVKPVSLKAGASRHLTGLKLLGQSFVIEAQGCRYRYRLDKTRFLEPMAGRGRLTRERLEPYLGDMLSAQIEPDFAVLVQLVMSPVLTAEGDMVSGRDLMIRLTPEERHCP